MGESTLHGDTALLSAAVISPMIFGLQGEGLHGKKEYVNVE